MVEADHALVTPLARFLRTKKAPKAKILLAKLEGKPPPRRAASAPGSRTGTPASPRIATAPRPSRDPGATRRAGTPARDGDADDLDVLRARLRVFESIYGLRGEVLARWGMTDEMPVEIMGRVFDMWHERLANGPDGLSRDLSRLAEDQRLLNSNHLSSAAFDTQ